MQTQKIFFLTIFMTQIYNTTASSKLNSNSFKIDLNNSKLSKNCCGNVKVEPVILDNFNDEQDSQNKYLNESSNTMSHKEYMMTKNINKIPMIENYENVKFEMLKLLKNPGLVHVQNPRLVDIPALIEVKKGMMTPELTSILETVPMQTPLEKIIPVQNISPLLEKEFVKLKDPQSVLIPERVSVEESKQTSLPMKQLHLFPNLVTSKTIIRPVTSLITPIRVSVKESNQMFLPSSPTLVKTQTGVRSATSMLNPNRTEVQEFMKIPQIKLMKNSKLVEHIELLPELKPKFLKQPGLIYVPSKKSGFVRIKQPGLVRTTKSKSETLSDNFIFVKSLNKNETKDDYENDKGCSYGCGNIVKKKSNQGCLNGCGFVGSSIY